jgi:hypothetical protein
VLTIEKLQSEYHLAEDRHALVGFLPSLLLTFSIGMWSFIIFNFVALTILRFGENQWVPSS